MEQALWNEDISIKWTLRYATNTACGLTLIELGSLKWDQLSNQDSLMYPKMRGSTAFYITWKDCGRK